MIRSKKKKKPSIKRLPWLLFKLLKHTHTHIYITIWSSSQLDRYVVVYKRVSPLPPTIFLIYLYKLHKQKKIMAYFSDMLIWGGWIWKWFYFFMVSYRFCCAEMPQFFGEKKHFSHLCFCLYDIDQLLYIDPWPSRQSRDAPV